MAAFKRMGGKNLLMDKNLKLSPMSASNWMALQLGSLFAIDPGESRTQGFTVGMGRGLGGGEKRKHFSLLM